MADEPLAQQGHFLHIYDFHVKPGTGEEFIAAFNEADYQPDNPMHSSPAQIKDGVLCRDIDNPDHFYLIGEWSSVEAHKAIRAKVAANKNADRRFVSYVVGGKFAPLYAEVVSATPLEILRAGRSS